MKIFKIPLFCICLFSVLSVFSQEQKNNELAQKLKREAVEVFRDRLVLDIFHTQWINVPGQVKNKFNPGFCISALWDFKATKKSPISFGLGLGCVYYTQFSNAQLKYDRDKGYNKYYILPDPVSSKLNKITYINCHIPIELRYRHKCGFKITAGVRLGVVAELSQRYKGDNIEGNGTSENYKYFLKSGRQNFNFDVIVRCGWKFAAVFYSYQVTKVFSDGKGPKINPMSMGISLSLF